MTYEWFCQNRSIILSSGFKESLHNNKYAAMCSGINSHADFSCY